MNLLSGYLKLYLNSQSDEPNMELHGEWQHRFKKKKEKAFKKQRNFKVCFYLKTLCDKTVHEVCEFKCYADELSQVIYQMGKQIIDEHKEWQFNTFESYAVVRV
ncbi:hypothetical protein LU293_04350 [Moraxella nasovis]|uniref:hypothetical protein n=1 Tax=Moraxella nasovis TaxID=2904121 RepID=UPI001F612964|nr:hypothetical protein [Moraxella nasovis]UNU74134.1 hypothetical protein LU293_04350 [Moraxella nasovis]